MSTSRRLRYLLCLAAALLAAEGRGQDLHAILVSDTSEWAGWGKYGPDVAIDSTSMFALLSNNVPADRLVLASLPISESGEPGEILRFVEEASPGPDDTLLFYFTGHGGNDDRGHHLLLEGGKLYRFDLLRALQAKGARMTVLVTDCCNTRDDQVTFMAPAPSIEEPATVSPAFQSLFFEPMGTVDINSSSPGESAFFRTRLAGDPLPRGSVFTSAFVGFLDRGRGRRQTWGGLVRNVSFDVHFAFREDYPKGARSGKGAGPLQTDQTVHAIAYPGMPERAGPRTGLTVRDAGGKGALIIAVAADSPAGQAVEVRSKRPAALRRGQTIVAANGTPVTGAAEFTQLVRESPQILRLRIAEPQGGTADYLMRLRY